MASITIKNLPDPLYDRLKAAAKAHHRSLNGEVIAALEHSLAAHRTDPNSQLASIRAQRSQLGIAPLDPGEIYDAIKAGRP